MGSLAQPHVIGSNSRADFWAGLRVVLGAVGPMTSWRHLASSSFSAWRPHHLEPLVELAFPCLGERKSQRLCLTLAVTCVDGETRAESPKHGPSDSSAQAGAALVTAQDPWALLAHTLASIS